jgi:hypothetical protein
LEPVLVLAMMHLLAPVVRIVWYYDQYLREEEINKKRTLALTVRPKQY